MLELWLGHPETPAAASLRQNNLITLFESNDRLLPIGRLAGLLCALTAVFAADIQGVHAGDFDFEQILDRLANLRLVCARIGHNGVLIILLALACSFFRQAHCSDDLKALHSYSLLSRDSTCSKAPLVNTSLSGRSTS